MNTEENLTQDNQQEPEPAYRKPGVQNFHSLRSDTIDVAKKQNKSLVQIVLSAKEKKWKEQQEGEHTQKVRFESVYAKPLYKILFVLILVTISALFIIKTLTFDEIPPTQQPDTTPSLVATSTLQNSTSSAR